MPQERLADLGDRDDRQCHGGAEEPLIYVERGGLQDRLARRQDGGHDEQEEGRPGRQDARPVGERAEGEHRLPPVPRLEREEQVEQRELVGQQDATAPLVWLVGLIWLLIVSLWILDMPTGPNQSGTC